MNCYCGNCGWSEIDELPIMCNYSGRRTWRDECCEAWKPKATEENNMVKVVRCKDCMHMKSPPGCVMFCEHVHRFVDDNWFCADGERKESR